MSKHTNEPWHIPNDQPIVMSIEFVCADGELVGSAELEEDARRIVACVNACAGIPTDVLEDKLILKADADIRRQRDNAQRSVETLKMVLDLAVDALPGEHPYGDVPGAIKELVKQRDELLTELTKLADSVEQIVLEDGSTPCTMGARGVIARVEQATCGRVIDGFRCNLPAGSHCPDCKAIHDAPEGS